MPSARMIMPVHARDIVVIPSTDVLVILTVTGDIFSISVESEPFFCAVGAFSLRIKSVSHIVILRDRARVHTAKVILFIS